MMARGNTAAKIEEEIAGLGDLSRTDLIDRWVALHRSPPPKGISRALLIRAVAYRVQIRRCGGLKPGTLRQLLKADGSIPVATSSKSPSRPNLKPGARLLREWNGKTHQVEVVETGFLWNDAHYRSLSAIARAITGARWSGPRFFGLADSRSS